MADVTLTYKGSDILELSDSGSATLKTGGTYCEDDIAVEYVKPSGGDPHEMLIAVNNNTATSVSLGDATIVKGYMFYGCTALTSFDFSKITGIGQSAFYGAGLIGNITVPNSLILKNQVFRNCKFSTIVFSGGVDRFDSAVFQECTNLQAVDVTQYTGNNAIANTAFMTTRNLKILVLRNTDKIVPLSSQQTTNGIIANSDANVYVPSSLVSSYQNATNWSTIANKITAIEGSYYETHYADGTVIS